MAFTVKRNEHPEHEDAHYSVLDGDTVVKNFRYSFEAEKLAGEKNVAAMALRIGDRIKEGHYYKTLYPVFAAGDLIAFLLVEKGYGKPWRLLQIKLGDSHAKFEGCSPKEGGRYDYEYSVRLFRKGDQAKEEALLKLAEHRTQFKTKAVLVAEQEAAKVEHAARMKRNREASEASQSARKERLEGLESIAKRTGLTNFERNALESTLIDLRNEVAHYERQLSAAA